MTSPIKDRARSTSRYWLLALGLGLGLAVVAAMTLWQLRIRTLEAQSRELGVLSLALTDEIDRGLQGTEAGMQEISAELKEGRLAVKGPLIGRDLSTRARLMPLVQSLWLVDDGGKLLASSDAMAMPELTSFSPPLTQLAESGISVSRPHSSGTSQEMVVILAIRFSELLGGGGWVLASFPATSLLGAFSAASPAADARMAVFRSDGVRLAGSIVASPTVDEAVLAQRLARQQIVEQRQSRDGKQRLVSLHSLPHFELKVMLTRDLDAVLISWREAAQIISMALLLLLFLAGVSVYFVQRADRRRAQAQFDLSAQINRTGRLESLGTLAGSVAHDFNNILAAIVGYGEMAKDAALPASHQARHLDKVLQAALRGKSLVERILAFSSGGSRISTVFELQPIVEEVLAMMASTLRSGIVIERRLEAPGSRLRGDPIKVFEAVMNLCANAMQAMEGNGLLTVQLSRQGAVAPRVLSHSQLLGGDYLVLTVSDQGSGITPEVMERLFEPFFTTRGAQSGTGLGLAVVHGVVNELGGAIDVQSTVGQGATFTLFLPESTEALTTNVPVLLEQPSGSGQTLLVLDDEPSLVGLVVEMLTGLGYRPVGFTDPETALEALKNEPHRFAAVITDEMMPVMTGTQLADALQLSAMHIPVLLVSGYGGPQLAQRAAQSGVAKVLAKPLQRAALAHALAKLLHPESPA